MTSTELECIPNISTLACPAPTSFLHYACLDPFYVLKVGLWYWLRLSDLSLLLQ